MGYAAAEDGNILDAAHWTLALTVCIRGSFYAFLSSADFWNINFFKIFFQEH